MNIYMNKQIKMTVLLLLFSCKTANKSKIKNIDHEIEMKDESYVNIFTSQQLGDIKFIDYSYNINDFCNNGPNGENVNRNESTNNGDVYFKLHVKVLQKKENSDEKHSVWKKIILSTPDFKADSKWGVRRSFLEGLKNSGENGNIVQFSFSTPLDKSQKKVVDCKNEKIAIVPLIHAAYITNKTSEYSVVDINKKDIYFLKNDEYSYLKQKLDENQIPLGTSFIVKKNAPALENNLPKLMTLAEEQIEIERLGQTFIENVLVDKDFDKENVPIAGEGRVGVSIIPRKDEIYVLNNYFRDITYRKSNLWHFKGCLNEQGQATIVESVEKLTGRFERTFGYFSILVKKNNQKATNYRLYYAYIPWKGTKNSDSIDVSDIVGFSFDKKPYVTIDCNGNPIHVLEINKVFTKNEQNKIVPINVSFGQSADLTEDEKFILSQSDYIKLNKFKGLDHEKISASDIKTPEKLITFEEEESVKADVLNNSFAGDVGLDEL